MNLVSNCCDSSDRLTILDGPSFSDVGICPECEDHCEFIDLDELPLEDQYDCPMHGKLGEDSCPKC